MKQFIELPGLAEGDFIGNYAPNPEAQEIYKALAQQRLGEVTGSQIATQTDPVFLQAANQDNLITMNIINEAAMRNGLPMPDTQKIIQTTYTSTGDDAIFFQPPKGEVWMLVGGDTLGSGGTGTINWSLKDSAGTLALLFISSINGQEPIGDNSTGLKYPIYISNTNFLFANITSVATSVRASLSFIRVR